MISFIRGLVADTTENAVILEITASVMRFL